MLNLDDIVSNKKESSSEHNDWPFRMLIMGPSGSGKTNTLLHLIDKFHAPKTPMKKSINI